MKNKIAINFCLIVLYAALFMKPQMVLGDSKDFVDLELGINQTELQWVVCEDSIGNLFEKLDVEQFEPKMVDVYYTDTNHLDLYNQGALIRTRVTQNKNKIKTAVKINYSNEKQIPWGYLDSMEYKCEEDRYIDGRKIGCSLYSYPENITQPTCGFQNKFIEKEVGFQDWDNTILFGPAKSAEWSWQELGFEQPVVVVEVKFEKKYYNIELSTRVDIKNTNKEFMRIQKWLLAHQIKLCPLQKGHTGDLLKLLSQI